MTKIQLDRLKLIYSHLFANNYDINVRFLLATLIESLESEAQND
jgi:hypothetical protein